jgi:hypothetical protein
MVNLYRDWLTNPSMNRKCLIKILYKEYLINQNFNFATTLFQLQICHSFKNNVISFCKRNVGKGYWIYLINQNFSFSTSVFQLQISHGFKNNVELFLQKKCRQRILNLFYTSFKRKEKGDLKSCYAHLSKGKK